MSRSEDRSPRQQRYRTTTVVITFVTLANVVSVRLAAGIQNIATSAKIFALAAIITVLFAIGDGTHGALASGSPARTLTLSGFVVGLVTATPQSSCWLFPSTSHGGG
jgi:amino acid transporter